MVVILIIYKMYYFFWLCLSFAILFILSLLSRTYAFLISILHKCVVPWKCFYSRVCLLFIRFRFIWYQIPVYPAAYFSLPQEKPKYGFVEIVVSTSGHHNLVAPLFSLSADGFFFNPALADPRFMTAAVFAVNFQAVLYSRGMMMFWGRLKSETFDWWRSTYGYEVLWLLFDHTSVGWMLDYINPTGFIFVSSLLGAVYLVADPLGDCYNYLADESYRIINSHPTSARAYRWFEDHFLLIEERSFQSYRAYREDPKYGEKIFTDWDVNVSIKEIDGTFFKQYIPRHMLPRYRDALERSGYVIPDQDLPGWGGMWVPCAPDGSLAPRPPRLVDPATLKILISPNVNPAVAIRVFLKSTDPETVNQLSELFNFLSGGG